MKKGLCGFRRGGSGGAGGGGGKLKMDPGHREPPSTHQGTWDVAAGAAPRVEDQRQQGFSAPSPPHPPSILLHKNHSALRKTGRRGGAPAGVKLRGPAHMPLFPPSALELLAVVASPCPDGGHALKKRLLWTRPEAPPFDGNPQTPSVREMLPSTRELPTGEAQSPPEVSGRTSRGSLDQAALRCPSPSLLLPSQPCPEQAKVLTAPPWLPRRHGSPSTAALRGDNTEG